MRQYTGRVALPIILAGLLAILTATSSLAQPNLLVGPSSLDFVAQDPSTQPASQNVFVASSGAPLPYEAKIGYWSTKDGWLSLGKASGVTPATLTLSANPNNLPDGMYFGYVEITTGTSPSTLTSVTLRVGGSSAASAARVRTTNIGTNAGGIFASLPDRLAFHIQTGQNSPRPQSFFLRGRHTQFTATSSTPWVSLTSNRNTTPGQSVTGTSASYLQVVVDSTGLIAGEYSASIRLESAGTDERTIPVTLTISDQPALLAEPSTLSFELHPGDTVPTPRTITIHSTSQNLNYTASTESGSWLAVGPQTGSTAGTNTVSITVNPADLPAANQTGYISVTAPGAAQPLSIPVNVTVNAAATGIQADKTAITLQGPLGTTQSQNLNLTSTFGSETFQVIKVISDQLSCNFAGFTCWLSVTPTTGTTPKTLVVKADPSLLPSAGTYKGTLEISGAEGDEVFVDVTFIVGSGSGGGVTPSPTSISFTQAVGGAAPAAQTVQLSGTSGTSFTTSSNASWLTASPASGTVPATLTITANGSALAVGSYQGSITVSGSSIPISVTLAVTGTAGITPSPTSLTFTQAIGGSTPSAQTVQLTSSTSTSFVAASNSTWLTVTPTGGTTPTTLSVTVSATGLAAGTYQGAVTVVGGSSNISIPVSFTVTGSSSPITPNPTSITFTQALGGTTAPAQTVLLTSTNTAVSFTTASSAAWLSVTPINGTTPATLTLTPNATGLAAGTYQGTVTVTSGSSQLTIPVTYNITSSATAIAPNPTSLSFSQSLSGNAPPSQTVLLSAASATSFTAVATAAWLTVTPTSGTTPATLTVSVNGAGLNAGTYQGSITVTSGSNTLTIPVSLAITTSASITPTPSSVTFSQIFGTATPVTQTVQLTSTVNTPFTVSSNASWLTASPTSGTTPAALTLTATPTGLGVGSYQGLITITSGSSSVSVAATLTIYAPGTGSITAAPAGVVFSQISGQMAFSLQNIQLSASSATSFTAASDSSWLTVSPSNGTTPATLTLTGTPGMAVGTYQGNITVAGGATPLTIPVTLTVSLASNAIAAAPTQVTFTQVQGAAAPVDQTVQLASPSPTAFTVTAPTSAWLTVTPTSGTTPASLTFKVDTSSLSSSTGSYQDSVTVNGGANPITIPVTLNINTDALTPAPTSLTFVQTVGAAAPNPQTVQLSSGAPRFFTAATTTPWLTVSPSTGTTPASLSVTANAAGLSVGSYTGSITVNGAGPTLTIPVTLNVAAATGATFSPTSLAFSYSPSGQVPAAQTVAVSSPGSPFSFTVTAQAANLGTWLNVTPTSGTTPTNLSVSVTPTGLAAGKYTGLITVTPNDPTLPAQTLPVTLTVGSGGSGGGGSSTIFVRSVLSAASFLPGPVAAGEIITVTGSGLGPTAGVGPNVLSSGAIDTTLAGTRVLFDGIPAPLLYVRADQINAIVPYNVYGRISTSMQVEVAGVQSDIIGLRVENTAPAIFTTDGSGHGTGAIVNQDGTINGPSFPAPAGSIVAIYGTGEGQTIPAGQDGRIISSDVRSPIAPVSVKIGGVPVQVRYAGSAPGQVSGLFQINVLLPATLAAGAQLPVEVQIGTIVSQAGVTMSVK